MTLTEIEYHHFRTGYAGYCTHCDAIVNEGVEPDAEGYECEICENPTVMGIVNALVQGLLEVGESSQPVDVREVNASGICDGCGFTECDCGMT